MSFMTWFRSSDSLPWAIEAAAVMALLAGAPGCSFDSYFPPGPSFKCKGEINRYARYKEPVPPAYIFDKRVGVPVAKGWVPYSSVKTDRVQFYSDRKFGPDPKNPNPLLEGSFLLQLPYTDRTIDVSEGYSDYYLRLKAWGQNIDRFWIAFDERATTPPPWLTGKFKKVTPERFIVSTERYVEEDKFSPSGQKPTAPVRYRLWEPKASVVTFVSKEIRLGGNAAAGPSQWKYGKVGSQYMVIVRVRPTPDYATRLRSYGEVIVEVEADTKAHITKQLLEKGKALAMADWLGKQSEPYRSAYRRSYEDGLMDVNTDPSKCDERCEWIDKTKVCKKVAQLASAPAVVNAWGLSSATLIDVSHSWADVEVVGQGGPKRTKLSGQIDFAIAESGDIEIGGFDVWGRPVTIGDGIAVTNLTIGQNATLTAGCHDNFPRGSFRLCDRYTMPAGDPPGFQGGVGALVDGKPFGVTLSNTRPLDLIVDFATMSFTMSGGPLEGTFDLDGDLTTVKVTLHLEGDVVNLAPVASVGEMTLVWECQDAGEAQVKLIGTMSFDDLHPSDIVSYEWVEGPGTLIETNLGSGSILTLPMALGCHCLSLFVEDSFGISSSISFDVEVVDSQIDSITPPPDQWALGLDPAGEAVPIGIATATDNCSSGVLIDNDAPPRFPIGFSTVEWHFDDQNGNLEIHQQKIFVIEPQYFPPPISATSATSASLVDGDPLQITHTTFSQGRSIFADEYVLVYEPDGTVRSIDGTNSLVDVIAARRTGAQFGVTTLADVVFDDDFTSASGEEGIYTVESSLIVPDGDPTSGRDVLARSWVTLEVAR